jgi:hypothetical protein
LHVSSAIPSGLLSTGYIISPVRHHLKLPASRSTATEQSRVILPQTCTVLEYRRPLVGASVQASRSSKLQQAARPCDQAAEESTGDDVVRLLTVVRNSIISKLKTEWISETPEIPRESCEPGHESRLSVFYLTEFGTSCRFQNATFVNIFGVSCCLSSNYGRVVTSSHRCRAANTATQCNSFYVC